MNTKHTPGPWDVVPVMTGYAINGHRIYAGDEIIARTHAVDEGYDEANATLISAAPDLLNALSLMLKYFNEDLASIMDDELQAVFAARAAIAKALGERQ